MCGIVGIVSNSAIDPAGLSAMNETLGHRGPDDQGVWISADQKVGLGHRRLAVLDPSLRGHNPMQFGEGRLWITYNGEIYNFRELREELKSHGYEFRSDTDTEVVLAAYDHWDVDCLNRLTGMFAFALWDVARQRLFLARDRMGQKPLYYRERSGLFAFASELKALLADPSFSRDIDPNAISMYLRYWYVPSPLSIFRQAGKLPPGHYALFEQGRLSLHCYWNPIDIALNRPEPISLPLNAGRLEDLLGNSVRSQMISDVPLGAFLSGGIDSSLIVAMMQEFSPRPIKTFTIRFEKPEFNEADYALAVARSLGTEHHEETVGVERMVDAVALLPDYFDEPLADPSAIPTYFLSRLTRAHVTVALSGDGGDELFFGYHRYQNYARRLGCDTSRRPWKRMTRALSALMPDHKPSVVSESELNAYAHWHTSWKASEIEAMMASPAQKSRAHSEMARELLRAPQLERGPLLDLVTYLPEDILTKVDRSSMASSLEARSPFLDHHVIEFALGLALDQKWNNGQGKQILREILYQKVPEKLLDRPKMGFSVPLADWFRNGLRETISSDFQGPLLEDLGINPKAARTLWFQFLSGQAVSVDLIWSLFTLTAWAKRWASAHALPRPSCTAMLA